MRAWVGLGLIVVSVFGLTAGASGLVGLGGVVFLIGIALVAPAIVVPVADAVGRPLELVFPARARSPAATCSATPDAARSR